MNSSAHSFDTFASINSNCILECDLIVKSEAGQLLKYHPHQPSIEFKMLL